MMLTPCILSGVLTAILISAIGYGRIAVLRKEKEMLKQQVADAERKAAEAKAEAETKLENAKAEAEAKLAESKAEAQHRLDEAKAEAKKNLDELKAEAQRSNAEIKKEAEERSKEQLAALKNEIELTTKKVLEERQSALEQGNKSQLDQILAPFNLQLKNMKEAFEKSTQQSSENATSFTNTINILVNHSQKLAEDTKNLTDALKNNGKVQGDWGEQVLATILENSGLRPGIEYEVQENVKDEEGNNLRPDVIVNCSDGRKVVIDSKVSLTGFTHYVNATTDTERDQAEKENLDSVKNHIKELVKKNYTKLVPGAVPYVLMFIPNEGSYILALQRDHNLASDAFQKNHVLIINPTNLMLALQLILMLWQFERKEENDRRIVEAATKMYEKFVGFSENFQKVGDQLQATSRTYETARGQLVDGKGNLIRQMEQLQGLGVATTKKVPAKLSDPTLE